MKLDCKIKIQDRQRTNGSSTLKAAKGVVGLAKSNNDEWVLVVRLFKDTNATQYKLRDNIQALLHRCINNGMATIQIKMPPHDVQLCEANVESLKTLLSSVRLASTGSNLPSSIKSISINAVEKLQRPALQLIVNQAIDYPTLKGFPSTLEKLIINAAHLRAPVDRRIFTLKNLHTLDLSDNNITELPSGIQMNHLHTLIIRSNQLKSFPNDIKCPMLKHLDLSQNQLEKFNVALLNISTLERLNLSSNKIKFIPRIILRVLPQLQVFNIASNLVRVIPNSIASGGTRLHTFHYDDNPLATEKMITCKRFNTTLLEIALRVVIKYRIPYDFKSIPRTLCLLLDEYETCAHCASACFIRFGEIIVPKQLSAIGVTVHVTAANQSFAVPVQERYCSIKCFNYGLRRAGMIQM
ncbi:unnamed protein product [Rotaria magnacalcarata]|uniref:PIF1/LRR1 pleckstrin homology domain-containing protein n=4 Tax=Rotaria magnacalcarata TaxID=392030 RepID=A0A816REF1_9BILA|nr:unnamed protein product [Rotaria magnacalcarata]CAF1685746.1 unnamed protein product [Rotaria magnacalcarata]CAF2057246.1 unnamed protein product [Rotaria magnacalcarata]CAF2057323.1 unnamed protein product [Rotaria magnacalcarata]CAF2072852.1 unnamed protein product [Rotaria magnacalcarata]